ncbi:hypothetical protein J6590_024460 [Homalodisca vitripennis]|nr:hypothetical protein J6590_024460 [Homalodisca vitripennis]
MPDAFNSLVLGRHLSISQGTLSLTINEDVSHSVSCGVFGARVMAGYCRKQCYHTGTATSKELGDSVVYYGYPHATLNTSFLSNS